MKRISLTLLISLLISANMLFADDFRGLWKDIEKKRADDLPASQIEMLDKVIVRAEQEKSYGNLMKAMKERMEMRNLISPDSFETDINSLEHITENTDRGSVLYAVYNSLLGDVYREKASNYYHCRTERKKFSDKSHEFFIKSLSSPQVTAGIYTHELYPFFSKRKGTPLLVSLAYNARMFDAARDYYINSGGRTYALVMSLEALISSSRHDAAYLQQLDSLIAQYGDLEECCMAATAKYRYLNERGGASNEEKLKFVRYALDRWGSYEGAAELKNAELSLTRPTFEAVLKNSQTAADKNAFMQLKNVRNISEITTTIWKTGLTSADIAERKNEGSLNDDFYQETIKGLKKSSAIKIRHRFDAADYVYSEKDFSVPSLGKGIYIIETGCSRKDMKHVYSILYVSDMFILSESLPHDKTRIAVVDLQTGRPLANIPLTVYCRKNYSDTYIKEAVSDNNGEIIFENSDRPYAAFASSDNDMFMPLTRINRSFGFRSNNENKGRTIILTDRAVYRPGQTVKVAVTAYHNLKGRDLKADSAATIKITLKDANLKAIATKTLVTDAYGTASAEFVLPAKTLNGRFSISDDRAGYTTIRVEEYRRPTFDVQLAEPDIQYMLGDTVSVDGRAVSFSGVPIQNAEVRYEIKRSWYPWLKYYTGGGEIISAGTARTSDDGSFSIDVPLSVIADRKSGSYTFTVSADVTDAAGETRNGMMSMRAGSKNVWIQCDLPDKIEKSEISTIRFSVKNTAGKDIDTDVTFFIDDTRGYMVKADTDIDFRNIAGHLPSGRHRLTIEAMGEKTEREFVIFSLDDKVPAFETDEWFYITSDKFPADGSSISMQVGSSLSNVHVLYTVLSGSNIIGMGTTDLDNEIKTFNLKYRDDYGDGILISYAWVKNGRLFSRNVEIKKSLPEKRLDVRWTTFRNRLVPGQKEQWTLHIGNTDGGAAAASVTASMYDMSLDNIVRHRWNRVYGLSAFLPYTSWTGTDSNGMQRGYALSELKLYNDDADAYEMFPGFSLHHNGMDGYSGIGIKRMSQSDVMLKEYSQDSRANVSAAAPETADKNEAPSGQDSFGKVPQLRENLAETAFFYPSLTTDRNGNIDISFTLPESTTTWKFMAFAHDKDMSNEVFTDEAVASKKIMIQPVMPRFVRRGDRAVISARIMNLSENDIKGRAVMQLCDAATEKVIIERHADFSVGSALSDAVTFSFDAGMNADAVICRIFAEGDGFSDGEQHYLNILSDREHVTNTSVISIDRPGTFRPDTKKLFDDNAAGRTLTIEYADNPQWFVIQALPYITETKKDDAISTATKIYAGMMARHIANASPDTRKVIEKWNADEKHSSLISNLKKNAGLKDMAIEETPWISDAETDTERMQHIAELFDNDLMDRKISDAVGILKSYQLEDGSWAWWRGMNGSRYVTLTVAEMLVRLESLVKDTEMLTTMTDRAMEYLHKEVYEKAKDTENAEKYRLSSSDIRYLYLKSLRNKGFDAADRMLLHKLEDHDISVLSIYDKAVAAVIFSKNGNKEKALRLVNSIKEYSVYSKAMGRYFDTDAAGYSWCDYKIPTQVMVIEALHSVSPEDSTAIAEMQQWLLQEKRTTSWDTPINAVNAVYAFTKGGSSMYSSANDAVIKINGREVKPALHGTGYVKTSAGGPVFDVSINKKSSGMSWLSMYGSYTSDIKDIEERSTGLSIKRQVIPDGGSIGSRIKVKITITADRDYDFVQITDKRAACMEPVNQISGYNGRYYCSMKDNAAYYYFDVLPKGVHIIETEYYIDRNGSYTTGTCKIQCAYAPAFNGRTGADIITVK